jgi:serine/threonine-protein kinase
MAALSHEHVVPIYAVDEHGGLPYFAMEYVPGGTLQARLSREGPLEVVAAVRIAIQTALALKAAHDSGLVHRDIKPANILLDRGVERVRVADFGLARTASEASYTASGVLAGTPQFMSPEQVRGEPCDGRSDLFSLGSVLYAMCTGHEPFRAESVYGVLQRIVNDSPRPIREQNAAAPAWLERFVGKLMAKDRADRFQSAADVAELLERELAHLQNPSIGPAPSRPWMRRQLWRWSAWSKAWRSVGLAAAALLAITALTAWRPWSDAAPVDEQPGRDAPAERSSTRGASTLARPTATLWHDDGAADALALADALEASPYGAATAPPPDPWPEAVGELRQRMSVMSQELSPLESPRSEP